MMDKKGKGYGGKGGKSPGTAKGKDKGSMGKMRPYEKSKGKAC